ncbi:glycosyltransferase family 39 protein [Actinoplanes subtropicus]|uniref:glycosyltransferase family 39 protein n=1 Tax=Actinoplanes subtropicus TaxID=543632 RepID=UPI00146FDFA6|nr:glycosyltransferase family 39 protein [Actinoplanes subtropicus]
MAMHIAEGRDFPDFMYGQSYMGSAESYLAAAVFRVSGPSLVALRVPMVLLFLVFLLTMYVLARRLHGTGVALVSVGLLALGSREVYGYESVTEGAIPETLLAGTILLLLGHRLLETADRGADSARRWLLAGWGLTATLGLWSTMLVAPFVLTSGVLVWLAHRRLEGRAPRGGGWALTAGLLVGALPWLAHDLTRPFGDSSLATLADLYVHGGTGLGSGQSTGLVSQVTNTLTISLAYITGGSAIAHPRSAPAWPLAFDGGWLPPAANAITTVWGLAVVLLWAAGLIGTLRTLRDRRPQAWRPQSYGRLAMLVSAGLATVAFAASPTAGVAPANNVRYLVGVLVATPALIAPLRSLFPPPVRAVTLGLVIITLAFGTVQAFRDASHSPGEAASRQLIRALQRNGISHIYGGYMDCDRLTFISREQITCAVLFEGPRDSLTPGFDRYLPYRAEVAADPKAAYVFRSGDPRNETLARSTCRWQSHWQLLGYEIWQPAEPCGVTT